MAELLEMDDFRNHVSVYLNNRKNEIKRTEELRTEASDCTRSDENIKKTIHIIVELIFICKSSQFCGWGH